MDGFNTRVKMISLDFKTDSSEDDLISSKKEFQSCGGRPQNIQYINPSA